MKNQRAYRALVAERFGQRSAVAQEAFVRPVGELRQAGVKTAGGGGPDTREAIWERRLVLLGEDVRGAARRGVARRGRACSGGAMHGPAGQGNQ